MKPYTAWSADGRGVERLECVHPNAIVDIPSDDENGGLSTTAGGVVERGSSPLQVPAPTLSTSLETRGSLNGSPTFSGGR